MFFWVFSLWLIHSTFWFFGECMEDSHSGLVRSLGKRVRCYSLRGFESLILRNKIMNPMWIHRGIYFIGEDRIRTEPWQSPRSGQGEWGSSEWDILWVFEIKYPREWLNPSSCYNSFMQKVIILNKKEGETPLQTLEGFRRRNKAYKNFKMTYAGRLDPDRKSVV